MTKRGTVIPSLQASAGRGIVIQITGDGESAKRALEMVQEELRRTQAETARLKEQAGGMSAVFGQARAALSVVGIGFGAYAIASSLRNITEQALELGETLDKASKKTGLAVGTLSTLHYISAVTNQDFDGMTSAVAKLDKQIASAAAGNTKAAGTMSELGLNAKDLASRSDGAEIAFKTLTTRIAATENPIVRVKLATDALGKAGAQQIPMLMEIGNNWDAWVDKAKEAGVYLDGPGAAALARASEHLKEMKQRAEGAGMAFTEGLVPGIQAMLDIMDRGKGDMNFFASLGSLMGRGLNLAMVGAYGLAEGLAKVMQATAALKGDKAGALEWSQVAGADSKELQDSLFFAKYGFARGASESRKEHAAANQKPHATGDPGLGSAAGKSDNPIAQAAAALAQEQAKLVADTTRASDQAQLAELDTQHKLLLLADADYYKRKFDLANQSFAAEQASLDEQTKKLEGLQKRQHNDKLLKRDKSGSSAEELKTARELVQLSEKQVELDAKKKEAESRYTGEVGALNNAAEIAGLRVAAALERERNAGIEAQIKLIEREHEIEAQKSTLAGGSDEDAQAIRDTGALAVQKLKLQEVEDDITKVEQTHRRAIDDTNDAVTKGDLGKRAAAARTRAANAQELQDLHTLADQYRAIAEAIGDDKLLAKSKDLDQTLANLGRTDRRGTFGKEVQDGLQGITTSIIDSAARGKQSFADMTKSILEDVEKLALKLAEEKFILPLFENAFGGGKGGGGGAGGPGIHALDPNGVPTGNGGGFGGAFNFPSIAANIGGGGGPSIYKPEAKSGGGFLSGALGIAGKLAVAALGGRNQDKGGEAPTVNIHNHSSQPISAGEPLVSFNSETQRMILDIFVQDHLAGGITSQF